MKDVGSSVEQSARSAKECTNTTSISISADCFVEIIPVGFRVTENQKKILIVSLGTDLRLLSNDLPFLSQRSNMTKQSMIFAILNAALEGRDHSKVL
eukprot:6214354-Pleurochrysis_carterae.AAC.1